MCGEGGDPPVGNIYRKTIDYSSVVTPDQQYQRLLEFRITLRRFDQWSREAAEAHGLTHAQHQLLLAIRGSRTPGGPTIGEVADALLVRPHAASELVDRAQEIGLVGRVRDAADGRKVHLCVTEAGMRILEELTEVHLAELRWLAAYLDPVTEV